MLRKIIVITCAPDCGVYRGSSKWKEERRRKKRTAILPTCFGYRCKQREDSGVNLGEVDSSGEKELVPA